MHFVSNRDTIQTVNYGEPTMNRLKQLRNSRGITQDELGRMLGVQKAAICKYENGRVNMPNSVIMRLVEISARMKSFRC